MMLFQRNSLRACRASILGMRATPAPARLIAMVPLSVLESVREDAKAHAAREAQLNDARFDEAKARFDARLDEAKARFDEAKARFDARLDEAKAHAAREAQLNDARFDEVKAYAASEAQHVKDKIELMEKYYAIKLARALKERDVALGKVSARALIEETIAEACLRKRMDAVGRGQESSIFIGGFVPVTEQLKAMLGFPGVAAYLQVAEEDNGLARGVLAKSAAIMYPALCTPLHARAAGAQAGQLPAEVSTAIGENGRIAFAALLAFGGRDVGNYEPCGAIVPVVLHVPPTWDVTATLQQIRDSAKLPVVKASVELGVAGGAEPFGLYCRQL
jgi:hypothetical protein